MLSVLVSRGGALRTPVVLRQFALARPFLSQPPYKSGVAAAVQQGFKGLLKEKLAKAFGGVGQEALLTHLTTSLIESQYPSETVLLNLHVPTEAAGAAAAKETFAQTYLLTGRLPKEYLPHTRLIQEEAWAALGEAKREWESRQLYTGTLPTTTLGTPAEALLFNRALDGLKGGIPYMSCSHSRALLELCRKTTGGSVRIRAPMGAGKTSLLHHVVSALAGEMQIQMFTLGVDDEKRLYAKPLRQGLGFGVGEAATKFMPHVAALLRAGVHVFIDEVQLMPPDQLYDLISANESALLVGAGVPAAYFDRPSDKQMPWGSVWTFPGLAVPRMCLDNWAALVQHGDTYLDLCATPFDPELVHVGHFLRLVQAELEDTARRKPGHPPATCDTLTRRMLDAAMEERRFGLAVRHWPAGMAEFLERVLQRPQPFASDAMRPDDLALLEVAESLGLLWNEPLQRTWAFSSGIVMQMVLYYIGRMRRHAPTRLYCQAGAGSVALPDAFNAVVLALCTVDWDAFWSIAVSHQRKDGMMTEASLVEILYKGLCTVSTSEQRIYPQKHIRTTRGAGSGVIDHWVDGDYRLGLEYVVCNDKDSTRLAEHLLRFLPMKLRTEQLPAEFKSAMQTCHRIKEYHAAEFKSACCVAVVPYNPPEKITKLAEQWNTMFAKSTATVCALVSQGEQGRGATVEVPGLLQRTLLSNTTPFTVDESWRSSPLSGSQLFHFRTLC